MDHFVIINNHRTMFVLREDFTPIKENGKLVNGDSSDGNDGIVKMKGHVYGIDIFHQTHETEELNQIKIEITANDIKNMYARIMEVEKRTDEQFWDV